MSDPVEYREIRPPPRLAPYVRCLWHLKGPAVVSPEPQPIVPDGCVELVLNRADPFLRVRREASLQPRAMVVGQLSGPVVVMPTGAVDVWGIRLNPWGAAAFLQIPVIELHESTVRLEDIDDDFARLASIVDFAGHDGRVAPMLLEALEGRARKCRAVDESVRAAVELITRDATLPSISTVGARLGRSIRWVQRTFRETIGLGPKMILRISRVQRAMRAATARPRRSWSSIAADVGYFDQSHLVRDFRQLVGCTPSEFLTRDRAITHAFIES